MLRVCNGVYVYREKWIVVWGLHRRRRRRQGRRVERMWLEEGNVGVVEEEVEEEEDL